MRPEVASDLEGLRQAEDEARHALFVAALEQQPVVELLYAYRDAVEARVRAEVEEGPDERSKWKPTGAVPPVLPKEGRP